MAGLKRINRQNLAQHRVTVPGVQDEIYGPLYDFVSYAAAGQTELNFFSVPKGQGTTTAPGATGTKTLADTNLTNAGLLPRDNAFYCTGIEVVLFPGINPGRGAITDATVGQFWDDVWAIGKSGVLTLTVGSRVYVQDGPLMNFPTIQGLGGVAAAATNTTAAASLASTIEYARFVGQPYTIVPLFIQPNQNFGVTMNWPAVVATVSTQAARIGVRLRGRFIRNAQ
jgi:hypothetical protein